MCGGLRLPAVVWEVMLHKLMNEFYDSKSGEWALTHSIICDAIEFVGAPMFYVRKEISVRDDIFGDDMGQNVLEHSHPMTMALLSYSNFDDAGTLFGKFGMNITDKIKLVVAQDVFQKITGITNALQRVGDMIYMPLFKKAGKQWWEIRAIDPADKDKLLQFGDEHVYVFGCNLLKLDKTDSFKTPIAELNNIGSFIDAISTLEKTEVNRQAVTFDPDSPFNSGDPFNSDK